MQLEVSTLYTAQALKEFYWFTLFRSQKYKIIMPIIYVVFGFGALLNLYNFIKLDDSSALSGSVVGLGVIALLFMLQKSAFKKNIQSSLSINTEPGRYVFSDEGFSASSNSPQLSGTSQGAYEIFKNVYETQDYFYLYITINQAYIVGKQDFTVGTPDDLRNLLMGKLGSKYKRKR